MAESVDNKRVSTAGSNSAADNEEIFIQCITKAVRLPEDLPLFDDVFYEQKRDFWRKRISGIKNVVAPMVDQSELAFRMMMRKNGAQLCYTPMIHANLFVNDHTYRRSAFSTVADDRPLIVQFCANDPQTLLKACRLVENFCDGVDLNLGCPQLIAKRGRYGAYLQEYKQLIASMISAVYKHCRLPISAKIRVLDDIKETVEYARLIERAGASMLTVHGRVREQRGVNTGLADWSIIGEVKCAVSIPVIANGNIQLVGDVERCIAATGADAVMSAEGILSNPLLFAGRNACAFDVAREYIVNAVRYKANISALRAHIFRICHYSLLRNRDLRERNSYVCTSEQFLDIVDELDRRCLAEEFPPTDNDNAEEATAARRRLRTEASERSAKLLVAPPHTEAIVESTMTKLVDSTAYFICKPYVRPPTTTAGSNQPQQKDGSKVLADGIEEANSADLTIPQRSTTFRQERNKELERLIAESGLSKRQIRKRERRRIEAQKRIHQLDAAMSMEAVVTSDTKMVTTAKKTRYVKCERCKQPAGVNCANSSCKRCCRLTCIRLASDCKIHRFDHVTMEAKRLRYSNEMGITLDELYRLEAENDERMKFLKNAKKTPLDMKKIEKEQPPIAVCDVRCA